VRPSGGRRSSPPMARSCAPRAALRLDPASGVNARSLRLSDSSCLIISPSSRHLAGRFGSGRRRCLAIGAPQR
jgi:hypothetical protein